MQLMLISSLLFLFALHSVVAPPPPTVAAAIRGTCDQLAQYLETDADQCLLWFGQSPPPYQTEITMNPFIEAEYAPNNPAVTIAMLVREKNLKPPRGKKPTRTWWAGLSAIFARNAIGQVRVLVGAPPANADYTKTIFYRVELKELTAPTSAVTEIIAINANDPNIQRLIWKKGGPHWGLGGADEAATPPEIFNQPTSCTALMKRVLGAAACPMPVRIFTGPLTIGGSSAALPAQNRLPGAVPLPQPVPKPLQRANTAPLLPAAPGPLGQAGRPGAAQPVPKPLQRANTAPLLPTAPRLGQAQRPGAAPLPQTARQPLAQPVRAQANRAATLPPPTTGGRIPAVRPQNGGTLQRSGTF